MAFLKDFKATEFFKALKMLNPIYKKKNLLVFCTLINANL